ncbi:MAG: bifunctional pyr operon transcriptional regulator/uracil phosphoribosyltransferase PyrR [Burkholderiaceae bacterium]
MTQTPPDAEATLGELTAQIQRALAAEPGRQVSLIGIHSGGAWIAERLHRALGLTTPLGSLSSAFHRDDYGKRGLPSEMKATDLPFEIAGADIILVDDILFTGRTVRAALNELFDYGRPARVELAVLLDRGGRELPIEARYCGRQFPLGPERNFVLTRADDGSGRLRLSIE